jgi:hypothetical protein
LLLFCCPLVLSSFGQLPYDEDMCPQKNPGQLKQKALRKKIENGASNGLKYLAYLNYKDRKIDRQPEGAESYQPYAGKRIRNIAVVVLDPYGVSIDNPNANHATRVQKFANSIQMKTRQWVVRNDLLFKTGDAVSPILFSDTERNLWDLGAFKDVKIFMVPIDESPDEIDVEVMVQDRWSWGLQSSVAYNRSTVGLAMGNFMGLPQSISNFVSFNYRKDDFYALAGAYALHNIKKTHIDVAVGYVYDPLNAGGNLNISRDFFSASTKWAGHVQGGADHQIAAVPNPLGAAIPLNVTYYWQDAWLAHAFKIPLPVGPQFDLTRLIVSGRISNFRYLNRPYNISPDGSQVFINQTYAMAGIGLADWNYYTEHSVYYIDQVEYLPKGFNASMVLGYDYDEQQLSRFYAGFKMQYSRMIKGYGYFDTRAGLSGYANKNSFQQGLLRVNENYFTPAFKAGRKFAIREFISGNVNVGINRPSDHEIVVNNSNGLQGIFVNNLHGSRTYTLSLETAVYPNFKVIGFSSCAFAFADFTVLQQEGLYTSQFNEAIGAGLRLRNVGMGLDYFEISFAYYPNLSIPGLKPYTVMGQYGNIHAIGPDNLFSAGGLNME